MKNAVKEGKLVDLNKILNEFAKAADGFRRRLEKVGKRFGCSDMIAEAVEKMNSDLRRFASVSDIEDEEYLVKEEEKVKAGRPRKAASELKRDRKRTGKKT
jgi:hypothetical protein